MITALAQDEPDPYRPIPPFTMSSSTGTTTTTSHVTVTFLQAPAAVAEPREPYRTTAHVGEPIREIDD